MQTPLCSLAPVLLPLALLAPASGQEVTLKDGSVLVGEIRKLKTFLEIETLDGKRRVKHDAVARIRIAAELKEALQRMAMRNGAGSAHSQLELARLARAWGLHDEMWRYLATALRSGSQSAVMQRRSREFMASLEREVLPPKWRKARPEIKVRELLRRIKSGKIPRAKVYTIATLLAKIPQADQHLRYRARRVTNGVRRMASVRALAQRGTAANERFVYRTALLDGSPQVRRDAMLVTKEMGKSKDAIEYLAPGLVINNAKTRMRTAAAFAELGDASALPLLVAAGPTAGLLKRRALPGGSTRAHMAVVKQQAFIRDYDVEVAQASFIANPKVDVIQSGVVLDVTVVAVTTRRTEIVGAYRDAIRRIAGTDPGRDPAHWASWLKSHETKVAATDRR